MKKKFLLTGWLLFAIACGYAQTDHIGSFQAPAHPRIWWFKGEEAAVQKTIAADSVWGTMHQAILAESDSLLKAPPLERIQIGRRLLATSREALRRMFYFRVCLSHDAATRIPAARRAGNAGHIGFQRLKSQSFFGCSRNDHSHGHWVRLAIRSFISAIKSHYKRSHHKKRP